MATVVAAVMALTLPNNFNPETNMVYQEKDNGRMHPTRDAATLASRLLANGAPEDIAVAENVLNALIACQETREGDPHYGNFWWYREDEMVEDLNAVEFVLNTLIPMMIEHGDRLSPDMQKRVKASIRLGLEEIERLNVLVAYTNIAAKDITNTCLGGELLNDPKIAARGYKKMVEWMAFTDQFGTPFEFNSPTYTKVAINAMEHLIKHLQHPDTKVRAQTMATRMGLSVALHIHPKTGRWAGPHSRAYHPTVVAETSPEIEQLESWIQKDVLPAWIQDAVDQRPEKFQVIETAYPPMNYGLTAYHSNTFDLGTAVTGMGDQSNVLIAHYDRPGQKRPGVFYTRYLINDKWLGDFYHETDRSTSRNLSDEGKFYGIQNGPRAIGLYVPNGGSRVSSIKAALIWTGRDQIDEIWVGDKKITSLPIDIPKGETIVIGSGKIYQAIRPFTLSDIGRDAPIRLHEQAGDLVLELYNYLGPEKAFWEMGWPGAFYKGKTQCGFYTEMAEKSDFKNAQAFAQKIATGHVTDKTEAPYVYAGQGERLWTVEYAREDFKLGLEVDLMAWKLKRRWNENGDPGWPLLDSPIAKSNRTGTVQVNNATLTCGKETGWLFVSPKTKRWVAGYHGLKPAPITLTLPNGKVEIDALSTGTIVWDNGKVTINAIGLEGTPRITGGKLVAQ